MTNPKETCLNIPSIEKRAIQDEQGQAIARVSGDLASEKPPHGLGRSSVGKVLAVELRPHPFKDSRGSPLS